jgi:cytochrome b561
MADTRDKLSHLTVILHWLIALAVIAMLAIGLQFDDLPDGPARDELLGLHRSIGLTVLAVALLRFGWRMANGFPLSLSAVPRWQQRAARLVHWVLLIGTLLMPVSGVVTTIGSGRQLSWFGLVVYDGVGANLLMIAILVHVAAALKHQLLDRDGTLRRMLGARV